MILVNKKEAQEIRKTCHNSPVVRLMLKDSKRHHYLATFDSSVQKLLADLRRTTIAELIRSEEK